jgi:hypothetical protein
VPKGEENMKITIEGNPEEIAAAITGMQTATTFQMQAMIGQLEAERFSNAMKSVSNIFNIKKNKEAEKENGGH